MLLKSIGKIIYDPKRYSLKKKKDWWVIAETDPDIPRYYRWFVKKRYWIDLAPPAWGSHISIIRGEKPNNDLMYLWKRYHLNQVEFEYDNNIQLNKGFCTIGIKSEILINIRKEFNLPTNYELHLTIGKLK